MSEQNSQIPKPELLTNGSPDQQLALKSLERDIQDYPWRYQIALGQLGVVSLSGEPQQIGPVDHETARRLAEFTAEPEDRKSLSLIVDYDDTTSDVIYAHPRMQELITEVRKHPSRPPARGHKGRLEDPEAVRFSRLVRVQRLGFFVDLLNDWQQRPKQSGADSHLPHAM